MKTEKSILFISVTFPPRLSVASLRLYNYARLFVKNGWNVTVLTSKQLGEITSSEFNFDGIEVIHVPWNDPFDKVQKIKNVFARKIAFKTLNIFVPYLATWLPDRRFKSWRINTLNAANKIINEKQIKYIYSSYSPPSPHLIARQLKRSLPHLFWISEYRDLWSHSHSNNLFRSLFAEFHFSFEKKVILPADLVLTVSEGHRQFLSTKILNKTHVLYNGCDFDSYSKIDSKREDNAFRILYTGNIYKKTYDVGLFFKSFKKFIENPEYNNSEIHFIGTPETEFLKALIQKNDLKEKVIFHKKKANTEIKVLQKSADVLLQFVWNNAKQTGNLTGKLFEYIAARKPILVVGEEKEVEKLISDSESGKMCSNEKSIISYLESIFKSNRASLKTIENRNSKISKENQFTLLESHILSEKK